MENEEADKKFTWVIKYVPTPQNETIYSDVFVIDGCTWRLHADPRGKGKVRHLSLFLWVGNPLPSGWKRLAKYRLFVLNQLSDTLCPVGQTEVRWFCERDNCSYFPVKLANHNGFLMNGEAKVVVEIDVLEVIGGLDDVVVVSKESEEVNQPSLKKIRLENGVSSTDLLKESVDVNGFQVLPSQVESVKRIFERHPDIAVEIRTKNKHLKTACMNVLLSLVRTLCQSNLSCDDLIGADSALTYVKDSGFKVAWLERKLEEVKAKKMEEKIGEIRKQRLEEELKECKQKCSDTEALMAKEKQKLKDSRQKCLDIEALLKEEKEELLATTRASPLKLDDII